MPVVNNPNQNPNPLPVDDFNEEEFFTVKPTQTPQAPAQQYPLPHPAHAQHPVQRHLQQKRQTFEPPPQMHTGSMLAKYYRIPGPHIDIPTKGNFMPQGSIEFTAAGDIPVFPMVSSDDMILKSPDALMSGLALEKLFASCVPAIKYPRLISAPDIDVLLLAIRVATYGNEMTLDMDCPECRKENSFDCNLPSILSTMTYTDTDNSVRLNDEVVAYVRPYNMDDATRLALVAFEETRRLTALDNENLDGQRRGAEVSATMERMSSVNRDILAQCLMKVITPEGEVYDKQEIFDFVANIPKPWVEKIDEKIKKLNDSGIDKTVHVSCMHCKHTWDREVEF